MGGEWYFLPHTAPLRIMKRTPKIPKKSKKSKKQKVPSSPADLPCYEDIWDIEKSLEEPEVLQLCTVGATYIVTPGMPASSVFNLFFETAGVIVSDVALQPIQAEQLMNLLHEFIRSASQTQ